MGNEYAEKESTKGRSVGGMKIGNINKTREMDNNIMSFKYKKKRTR